MNSDTNGSFNKIFQPRSIAIIGVATEGFGFGRGILLSLLSYGYKGKIYPVNPKGGIIHGLTIFKTVEDIPDCIDFGIIAVPAHKVPDAVEACRKKGAAGVEILSSGFKEIGTPEGIQLEEQISRIAAAGIRVIGPNCFGIYSPRGDSPSCRVQTFHETPAPSPLYPRAADIPSILPTWGNGKG